LEGPRGGAVGVLDAAARGADHAGHGAGGAGRFG